MPTIIAIAQELGYTPGEYKTKPAKEKVFCHHRLS
jgi:hypothetical protein